MFCKNCGVELPENANVCLKCGVFVGDVSKQSEKIKNETNSHPVCPKTYLVESILVTMFCCLPFGVVGIINAVNVTSSYAAGRYEEAETASQNAQKYIKIGAIIGGAVILLYFLIVLIAAICGSL